VTTVGTGVGGEEEVGMDVREVEGVGER